MKCLHAGVRSNADKTQFGPWNATSNLSGLRTRADFEEDYEGATIMLRCKAADVDQRKDELYFVAEPKLRIDCVRGDRNLQYSKYITDRLDSVAYHDEPLFLKFKEVIKLILAMEWLKEKLDEKKLKFSQVWINEHLAKRKQSPAQRIEVAVPPQKTQRLLKKMAKTNAKTSRPLVLLDSPQVRMNDSKTGLEVQARAGSDAQETYRGTFNDWDYLLQDQDPNQPTNLEVNDNTDELWRPRPNVKSWNQLYSETVPQPFSVLYTAAGGPIERPVTGGVTTRSFPTNPVKTERPSTRRCDEVTVTAGERSGMSYSQTPKPKAAIVPDTDVGVTTRKSEVRAYLQEEAGANTGGGILDTHSFSLSDSQGQVRAQGTTFVTQKVSGHGNGAIDCPHEYTELKRDGTRGPKIKLHKQLLPPHASSRNLADECAKAR